MAPSFLIVDADRNFREALAIALRLDGHVAQVVASAEDALAHLRAGGFTCCVVDAHQPGADEVLEGSVSHGLRTVLTGPYPDLLAQAARRHPGVELLAKPFQAAELAGAAD